MLVQPPGEGTGILSSVGSLGGPGYRDHQLVLAQQPIERHLAMGNTALTSYERQRIEYRLPLVGGTRAGTEQAAAKWTVGNKGDVEFPARVEHAVAFGLSVQKAVLDLVGSQRDVVAT